MWAKSGVCQGTQLHPHHALLGQNIPTGTHLLSVPRSLHELGDGHAARGLPLHCHGGGLQHSQAGHAASLLLPRGGHLGDVVPLARDGEMLLRKALEHLGVDVPAHPVLGSLLIHRVL